jgi:hypothetical protein
MRYLFLGLSLSSALTAAGVGLATAPSHHSEQRANMERPAATQTHTHVRAEGGSVVSPVVNLPQVGGDFSSEKAKDDCWDRLNLLLAALDSHCS